LHSVDHGDPCALLPGRHHPHLIITSALQQASQEKTGLAIDRLTWATLWRGFIFFAKRGVSQCEADRLNFSSAES
jgi:hypothetical protein